MRERVVAPTWHRHGLLGERVCLSPGQLRGYFSSAFPFLEEFRPVRVCEIQLVHRVIDTAWRADSAARIIQASDPAKARGLTDHERYFRFRLRRLRLQVLRLYLNQDRRRRYASPFELSNAYLCYKELIDLTDRVIEESTPLGDRDGSIKQMESVILKLRCFAKSPFPAPPRGAECHFEKTLVPHCRRRGAETPASPQPSL
jgi:hypothetical protein